MDILTINFRDIDWGEDEARKDNNLQDYFVEIPEFRDVLTGNKRYIIGRKGTGKSAILKKIRLASLNNSEYFYKDVSLRDFPLVDFKSLGDKAYQDKGKYVSAWKFIMLTELIDLILSDNSIEESEEIIALRQFVYDNFPNGISIAETLHVLKEKQNKVSFLSKFIGGELQNGTATDVTAVIHYNKAVDVLENILKKVESHCNFFLLIDELDEGYKSNNTNLSLVILALLRASDELYAYFSETSLNIIPVVSLRSDIFDSLEDNDLNKLDDYVLRLNWSTDNSNMWGLKQIIDKRIEAAVKKKYPTLEISDYWSLIAEEQSVPKGLWQYICILTFSRPRDVIKLMKYCKSLCSHAGKLTLYDVQNAEIKYSDWFFREFRDEVQSFMSCWKSALNCISELSFGKAKMSDLSLKLEMNNDVKTWCNENKKRPEDVIRMLFDYSVIGCINDQGRWIFKYKDDYFEYMPSYPYYCVHYGFCRKLRITRAYDREIIEVYRRYK